MPNEVELRMESERVAQLAGQAYAMASQAQGLLDIVARSNSRISASGHGSAPTSPMGSQSVYGSAPYSSSPSSPPPARGVAGGYNGGFQSPSYSPPPAW